MGAGLEVEAVRAHELTPEARALWSEFRAARPELASPYFDLRYVQAAAEVTPGGAVAVIRREGRIVAFLPIQRRGGLIQPLAAPLTDYHGLIAAPDAEVALPEVVRALGAGRFRFSALLQRPAAGSARGRPAMRADLTGGYDAYLDARRAAGHGGFLKDKARRARLLEREQGPVTFTLDERGEGALELIIALKRRQMRSTGQHDVFSTAWTRRLLQRLAAETSPDFGLRFAVLRANGKVIAAEVGLRSGEAYHLWFPVYDPAYARYSPGALMTLEALRALADQGVKTADFGPEGEDYKRVFADPADEVFEGEIAATGRFTVRSWIEGASGSGSLGAAARRLDRRLDRITACEPGLNGRLAAALRSMADLGRRRFGSTLGLTVGLAASRTLLSD